MPNEKKASSADECEQWFYLTLSEVTYSFGVDSKIIFEMIDEGIISAPKDNKNKLQFDDKDLRRIRTALQLHRDLGVNIAGAALAIELMRDIERLNGLLLNKN